MATKQRPRAPDRAITAITSGDLYVGGPNTADVLALELSSLGAKDGVETAPGVVVVRPGPLLDPAFARQAMPRARLLTGANANELAATLLDAARGDAKAGPADVVLLDDDVEVSLPEVARRGSHALDEHPLEAARVELTDLLRTKITGRRVKHGDARPSSGHRARVLLVDAWSAWLSITTAPSGPALLSWPSPFPGGRALDEHVVDAPSSAHRKLDEALRWLEASPGADDVVIDLGAAPGGWSWAALQRGARVIAVDRADMDPKILEHERLEHVRADAFKYVPERQPTWLLCDVIAEPERSLDVVARAVKSSALRGLVVTLKLKKPVKLDVVAKARALCRTTPGFFGRTKQLAANKLEVTVMMKRA